MGETVQPGCCQN